MVAASGRARFQPARLTTKRPGGRTGAALKRAPVVLLLLAAVSTCAAAEHEPSDAGHGSEFSTSLHRDLSVPAGRTAEQDLLALGAQLTVDGEAAGDAVALHGDVIVTGIVHGDAIALGGRVRVGRTGHVDGNAFALFGGVDLAEGARVDGRVRSLAPLEPGQTAGYLTTAFSRPALITRFLALVFWILAALIAAFAAPSTVARAAAELGRHPLRLAGIGALLGISFLLTLVLFVALIPLFVGIPLLILLLLGAIGLIAVALAAAFHGVGARLTEPLSKSAVSGYVALLAGALVLGLLHFVPVLGELLWVAAILAGAGSVAATRLGRPRSGI